MRFLFCVMVLLFNPVALYANNELIIVSGFDDVLRQADNTGLVKSAIKILQKDRTFSGMPELYQAILGPEKSSKFFVVSAISTSFESRIIRFLKNEGYPENHLYLRSWMTEWSIEDFKISRIGKIVQEDPHRKLIIIFDNSDPSIEMTSSLRKKFGDRIQQIYLRKVVDKEMPAGAFPFFTAFDIALNEFAAGRLTLDEVHRIGQVIANETQPEKIIPSYALCPNEVSCKNAKAEVVSICDSVKKRLEAVCIK